MKKLKKMKKNQKKQKKMKKMKNQKSKNLKKKKKKGKYTTMKKKYILQIQHQVIQMKMKDYQSIKIMDIIQFIQEKYY